MLDTLRRKQTLASFDHQWAELRDGDAMLSDPWFREHVDRILVEELLCVERDWFRGRSVLDAGCGIGRWTLGLLRLGCHVTAVDASASALRAVETGMKELAPDAVAEGRLQTQQVNLLGLPADLRARKFDLVFSFGVLHHTGDTRGALGSIAPLVNAEGLLFLYLYGSRSVDLTKRIALAVLRYGLAPLPFAWKARALRMLRAGRDPHQSFDTFSPLINDTYAHETVEGWLRELGFPDVTRTIDYTDLYLRARRGTRGAHPLRTPPQRPYWFERYRRRPLPAPVAG